ncbi:MAG: hypothetical protein LBB54_00045 [Cellulomonadaceae bacterium]|nr:hypothetical protein [Cellulomonadaceae bacterium]
MPPIAADGRPPQPTPLPPRPGTGQIPLPASIDNGEGALLQALRFGDTEGVGAALNNDLEAAALALRPDLARVLDIAHSAHALGVIVSGSGPTVAALARTERHARTIAATWTAEDAADHVWVAAGPTQGARIIG